MDQVTTNYEKKNTKKEINDPRVIFAKNIIAADIEVKCNFFGFNNISPVWSEEFNNAISSCYMGLCLQRKPQLKYCLSDRIAQYGGNGLMLFIEKDTQLNEFLNDNEEAVAFNDMDEIKDKINDYNKNKVK